MKIQTFIWILFLSTILTPNILGVTYNATVAKDGTGNYTTVQAALNAAPSNSATRWVIYIKNGTYKEMLNLASGKNNITLYGQSNTGVILTYDNYATKINPSTGAAYGTSGSASTFIYGTGFYAYNVTFQNSAGAVGQALAISVRGDKSVFHSCRFLGYQDTYYGHNARNYFYNCYFEGTTDFIFGSSIAWYESCQIYCKGGTSITAASTEPYVPYGYVFNKCTITGAGTATTDLGRPWQPYASVTYMNSSISGVIKAAGWNDWGNSANQATARFGEYNNTGTGASMTSRPAWIKRITASQAASYTVLNVMKGTYASPQVIDNWNPQTVIDLTNGAAAATLTKHGGGSSSQTVAAGAAITSFYYTWANATSATITGLPTGVTASLSSPNVTISGTPTTAGTYTYTITTTGGTPNVSVSGTITVTSSSTTTLIYQGENAVINTGVTETKNAGYTGTGYANADNAIGTYVEWTVTTSTAGPFSIFFRYATIGDRPADIYVNSTKVISALAFPTTIAWTTWSTTVAQNVTLLNGANKIRVTATTTGGPANLDYLQVSGSGTLKSVRFNNTVTSFKNEIDIYPNPVNKNINITGTLKESGNITIYIYNLLGRKVDSKNLGMYENGSFNISVPIDKIRAGSYILKVYLNSDVKTLQFIKQ